MTRKLLGISAVVVLASTTFALADPGVSGAAALSATGSVGCKITGSGKFSPKLTLAGSSTVVKIKFTATSTGGCGAQATIPGATVSISAVSISGSRYLGRDHGLLPRLDHRKSPVLDRGGELDSSVGQYLATTSSTISALTFIS